MGAIGPLNPRLNRIETGGQKTPKVQDSPQNTQNTQGTQGTQSAERNTRQESQAVLRTLNEGQFEPAGSLGFPDRIGMPAPPFLETLEDIDNLVSYRQQQANADPNIPTGNQYAYYKLEEKINQSIGTMDDANLEALASKLKAQAAESPEDARYLKPFINQVEKQQAVQKPSIGMPAPDWVQSLGDADKLINYWQSQENADPQMPTGNQYAFYKLEEKLNQSLAEMGQDSLNAFAEKLERMQAEASPQKQAHIARLLERAHQYLEK